jgi:hypothetical protein
VGILLRSSSRPSGSNATISIFVPPRSTPSLIITRPDPYSPKARPSVDSIFKERDYRVNDRENDAYSGTCFVISFKPPLVAKQYSAGFLQDSALKRLKNDDKFPILCTTWNYRSFWRLVARAYNARF